MNDKFFSLSEEKQLAIINAGYKVFGNNKYNKAPVSEIAEAGGISKALLFHYFENKMEFYIFLWEKAEEISNELKDTYKIYDTDDYFESLKRGLYCKCELMRKYPYMTLFSITAFYEDDQEVRNAIQSKIKKSTDDAFVKMMARLDKNQFRSDVSFESIYREILYSSEGLLSNWYRRPEMNVDAFEKEYLELIEHWKIVYKK